MPRFRHAEMKTDMIQFVMLTQPDSDNKQHVLELLRVVSSLLLCAHLSPLAPGAAIRNCARGLLSRDRTLTAKTRRCLEMIGVSPKGPVEVLTSLLQAVNQIELDYTVQINNGLR